MSTTTIELRQQKRALMLQRIYEATNGSIAPMVPFYELSTPEGIDSNEAHDIMSYLHDAGVIEIKAFGGIVSLTTKGIDAYEKSLNPWPFSDQQANVVHVGTVHGGLQVGGHHNTQTVTYSSNDAVGEALLKIIEAVKASQLNEHDKDDAMHSLEQLQKLSKQDKTPDVIERAKKKLDIVQGVIKTGADLATIVAPYLPAIASHFGWLPQ